MGIALVRGDIQTRLANCPYELSIARELLFDQKLAHSVRSLTSKLSYMIIHKMCSQEKRIFTESEKDMRPVRKKGEGGFDPKTNERK